jgi:hypothetical protein
VVRAQDTAGVFDTSLFVLRVRAASELTVTVTGLPDAQVGEMYLQKLTARQGLEPYQWRVFGGSLPSGLELAADGTISGTPSMVENAVFFVEVTDAAMQVRLQPLSLRVVDEEGDGGCGCNGVARDRTGSPLILLLGLFLVVALRRTF